VTWLFRERAQNYLYIGTILDADGTPSGSNTHDRSSGVPIMRGFMNLRQLALRVNNDVPSSLFTPSRTANFLVRRWGTSEMHPLPLFRLFI
jgi:hypothetical protein